MNDGLDRDERLGVIERVPENTPSKLCSRMVTTAKADGSPRRVVDYQAVNTACPRQTHHTETPWALVSSPQTEPQSTYRKKWSSFCPDMVSDTGSPAITIQEAISAQRWL